MAVRLLCFARPSAHGMPTCATSTVMQEVSVALWALAKLRANRPKLLRVLADRADALSEELNPQDLATVMWAFGSVAASPRCRCTAAVGPGRCLAIRPVPASGAANVCMSALCDGALLPLSFCEAVWTGV